MRRTLRFMRRGTMVELAEVGPNETLLDYLRLREGSCGTKEGCGEGDCGACTVAIGSAREGAIVYEPVNACIYLLGMIDGKELVTVEDLATEGALHPVQRAMVDHHASQCGFCTPGFVMSLFALYQRGEPASRPKVNDWLAGNLCRCTGYRPIVDAALAACGGRPDDRFAHESSRNATRLGASPGGEDLLIGDGEHFFAAPASLDSLAQLYLAHPDAVLVGGATDVGLWITKQLEVLPKVIHLGRVAGLDTIEDHPDRLVIGAGSTYSQAEPHLAAIDADVGEVVRRIGSKQVRAVGTIGGNIANGSPIGDTPAMLIALGAELELRQGAETRKMPLEDFFLAYGKQDRQPGEFVRAVQVPKLAPGTLFRSYKLSKRFDQDISALLAAFRFRVDGGHVTAARIAFGGMAATPKRAPKTEAAVTGLSLSDRSKWTAAADALSADFAPISDFRASSHYRMTSARALLLKALAEVAGTGSRRTRVSGVREGAIERVA